MLADGEKLAGISGLTTTMEENNEFDAAGKTWPP